jgi:hypothetical protein
VLKATLVLHLALSWSRMVRSMRWRSACDFCKSERDAKVRLVRLDQCRIIGHCESLKQALGEATRSHVADGTCSLMLTFGNQSQSAGSHLFCATCVPEDCSLRGGRHAIPTMPVTIEQE